MRCEETPLCTLGDQQEMEACKSQENGEGAGSSEAAGVHAHQQQQAPHPHPIASHPRRYIKSATVGTLLHHSREGACQQDATTPSSKVVRLASAVRGHHRCHICHLPLKLHTPPSQEPEPLLLGKFLSQARVLQPHKSSQPSLVPILSHL